MLTTLLLALGGASAASAAEKVLVFGPTVSGGANSIEAMKATSLGYEVEVVDDAGWSAKSAADFASYRGIILGDPTCGGIGTNPWITTPTATATTWGPQVDGSVIVVGTDPVFHQGQGGRDLTEKGVAFALSQEGRTGAYITLSCYFHGTAPGTPVDLLDGFGEFTAKGVGCFDDAHIVATHPALDGLTDTTLSGWGCSVHEAFDKWPAQFDVLAIARNAGGEYTAGDGTVGTPYIVARGVNVISTIKLEPETATRATGTTHTLTATVAEDDNPIDGTEVTFTVLDGPNAGVTGTGTTNGAGVTTFGYTSAVTGTDTIRASYQDSLGRTRQSNAASVTWEVPPAVGTQLVAEPALLKLIPGIGINLYNLKAKLTAGGAPVAGKSIAMTVSGTPVCSATTGANGVATCSGFAKLLKVTLGLGYTATFAGDATHLGSSDDAPLVQVASISLR